jgi:hypothetical protein
MDDPIFRAYMKRVPPALHANALGKPWQVWVDLGAGRWRTGTFSTYREVWPVFVKHFKADDHRDVTITSRRVFYAPPGEWYKVKVRKKRRPTPDNPQPTHIVIEERWRQTFYWEDVRLEWCGRCRRPSHWMPLFADHHALRRFPTVAPDDNRRCVICGIRWIAQPPLDQMERL